MVEWSTGIFMIRLKIRNSLTFVSDVIGNPRISYTVNVENVYT